MILTIFNLPCGLSIFVTCNMQTSFIEKSDLFCWFIFEFTSIDPGNEGKFENFGTNTRNFYHEIYETLTISIIS